MAPKRCLIVEDEAIAALALEMELIQLGHTVIGPVAFGEKAVDAALQLKPDFIFMDIFLEGAMTGVDAVRAIHAVQPIPICYTTASQNPEMMRQVQSTEHVDLLQKPYLTIEIVRVLGLAFTH